VLGEVPVMTESQDPAAGDGPLMAGHADIEQVIEALKNALVQSRLTRDELGARAGRALAALTADIPAEDGPARPSARARRRPLVRAAGGSVGCLVIAFGALRLVHLADPGAAPGPIPESWVLPCILVAIAAVAAALIILGYGVGTSIEQRRSRRQLPPRARRGGHPPVFRVTKDADGDGAGGADVMVW
jgi:hypothetical protein